MKLYFLPGACQIGIHALLAEIGQPFEIEKAARPGTPEFEAYTQINPKGKVPALIRNDGSLLTEFPVIALYLARMNPERELIPTDIEGEIRVLEMTEHLVSTVHMQGYTRARRPEKFAPSEADHAAVKAQGLKIFQAGQNDRSTAKTGSSRKCPSRILRSSILSTGAWSTASDRWVKVVRRTTIACGRRSKSVARSSPNSSPDFERSTMDMLLKLKAFVVTADTGNFSAAARTLYTSPSVIMKRVDELEWDFKTTFFDRSTRRLTLTDTGQSYLTHARQLLRSYSDMASGAILSPGSIEGPIRIKAPAVLIRQGLGDLFTRYRADHPRVQLEIVASDRGGNPAEEGFDISVGMDQMAYSDVLEQVIRPFPRVMCAAPAYLSRCEPLLHPRDLINHPCLSFSLAGSIWAFNSPEGRIEVDVRPVLITNDEGYLCAAARDGQGIVQLALPIVADALEAGELVPVLEQFSLVERWVKIMVPTARLELTRVKLLFDKMAMHLTTDKT